MDNETFLGRQTVILRYRRETAFPQNWPFPAIPGTAPSTRRTENSSWDNLAPQVLSLIHI